MKRLFLLCAALGAGEALGLSSEGLSVAWPLVAVAAVVIALLGYGFAWRPTLGAVVFLVGLALGAHSADARESSYRTCFWRRAVEARRGGRAAGEAPFESAFPSARASCSRRLGLGLEHDTLAAGLNRAILLGERARLPGRVRRAFVAAGTVHVFAISGLHVMFLARAARFALVVLGFSFRFASALTVPILGLYVLLVGAPPSSVRAATMAGFYLMAPLFYRRSDALVAWALAFLLMHVLAPRNLLDVGNALSFTVMLSILIWARLAQDSPRVGAIAIPLAAWAGGVPMAAHVFGRITPGGLLANLVLLPAAFCSVTLGILAIVASFISETVAAHLNNAAALSTNLMAGVSSAVATLPGANVVVPRWPIWECVAWYVAMGLGAWLFVLVRARRSMLISIPPRVRSRT